MNLTDDQLARRMEAALKEPDNRRIAVITEEYLGHGLLKKVRIVVDGKLYYQASALMRNEHVNPSWYELIGREPDLIIYWRDEHDP